MTAVRTQLRTHSRALPYNRVSKCPNELLTNRAQAYVDAAVAVLDDIWHPAAKAPLYQFVREVLRRCQYSLNLLQVSLYYLMKAKLHLDDKLPCCRRAFLTSLILAGKYLQDRPCSLRAWSRLSGLGVETLRTSELNLLDALNWDLYIPHHGLESLRLYVKTLAVEPPRSLSVVPQIRIPIMDAKVGNITVPLLPEEIAVPPQDPASISDAPELDLETSSDDDNEF